MAHPFQQARHRATRGGFTLVELLLVMSVILLLAGAVVISFDSAGRGSRLDEGATQLEALFRFARAEAASTGRPVRVVLAGSADRNAAAPAATPSNAVAVAESTAATPAPAEGVAAFEGVGVHWEPDPLGSPGHFEPVASAAPLVGQINELVRVLPAEAATNAVPTPLAPAEAGPEADVAADAGPAPVMFYPDGSSDSAELVLVDRNEEDHRRMIVRLSGMTGVMRRVMIAPGDEPMAPAEPARPEPVDPVTGPPAK